MGKRIEFRFSGSGGQGIISAGIILAAAAVHDGKYAIQSQSYGPEARGGSSKAEVVISEEPIDYPKATTTHSRPMALRRTIKRSYSWILPCIPTAAARTL